MREQRKFVEKLESFTESLSDIVDILKEETERRQEIATDKLAQELKDNIVQIAEDIKVVKEDISSIKTDAESIKHSIEELKTQKEKGLPGEISQDGKGTIIEGVKTIILIAGGVLAIGMAFKLIGDVDVASVVSLSIAIVAIAKAVEFIGNIENLSYKTIGLAAFTLVTMASAIYLSSLFFSELPAITAGQLLTSIAIAASVGLATYLSLMALDNIKFDKSTIAKIILLPIVFPLVSLGIVLSALILNLTPDIDESSLISSIGVAFAIGIMTYAIKPFLSMDIKPADVPKFLLLPFIAPILSFSIAASAFIINEFMPKNLDMNKFINLAIVSASIGLSLIAFLPTIYIMSKLNYDEVLIGIGSTIAIAGAIVLVSWIISQGEYDGNVPGWKWSLQVGLSLIAFIPAVYLLGQMNPKEIITGTIGSIGISLAIMVSSHLLSLGNYDNYPDWKWALGVGLSLLLFTVPVMGIGIIIALSGGLGFVALGAGILAVSAIAGTISAISHIIGKGSYGNFPEPDWAEGVGKSLFYFGTSMLLLGGFMVATLGVGKKVLDAGATGIVKVAEAISLSSYILKKGTYDSYPSPEWAEGVGNSINLFSKAMKDSEELEGNIIEFIPKIVLAIIKANEAFKSIGGENIVWSGHPTEKWATTVGGVINAFSNALSTADAASGFFSSGEDVITNFIEGVVKSIIKVNEKFGEVDEWYLNEFPDESISKIVRSAKEISSMRNDIDVFEDFIDGFSGRKIRKAGRNIDRLSYSLERFSRSLRIFGENSDNLKQLDNTSISLELISALDIEKISDTLDTIDEKSKNLNQTNDNLYSMIGFLGDILNKEEKIEEKEKVNKKEEGDNYAEQMVNYLASIDNKLNKIHKLKIQELEENDISPSSPEDVKSD